MPRRFHAGHHALAGLLVAWLVGDWPAFGSVLVPFGFSIRQERSVPAQEAGSQWSFGPSLSNSDSWLLMDNDDHRMEVEGWGNALFVTSLWKMKDDGEPGRDLWVFEQQGSVAPEPRDHRPDPVVSRLRMRGYPTAETVPVLQDYAEWATEGVGRAALALDREAVGDAELLLDEGRFGGESGERFANYSVMFVVDEGAQPQFQVEREIAFRSAFGSRSCASAGEVLDVSADPSPECVVEAGR